MTVRVPEGWQDYELIDSGDGAKLERFGSYVVSRPDPRAFWGRNAPQSAWDRADAAYLRADTDEGRWNIAAEPPDNWHVRYAGLTFTLRPTSFKHVGVFPEQADNWEWMRRVINGKPLSVLNLFAYTGGATMAAAQAGAKVTHVDSAKSAIDWANANVKASGLSGKPIRWIVEDAYKFVLKESRRGNTYDGVILDPPRFGRGSKGEVWKIEDGLPKLLAGIRSILSPDARFIVLNAYTADLSSIAIGNALSDVVSYGTVGYGELALKETFGGRLLPAGIFARWSR